MIYEYNFVFPPEAGLLLKIRKSAPLINMEPGKSISLLREEVDESACENVAEKFAIVDVRQSVTDSDGVDRQVLTVVLKRSV
jgi:hypothetical protein